VIILLFITRKFTIGIQPNCDNVIAIKLEEFDITVETSHLYKTKVLGKPVEKLYITCICSDEKLNKLIDYLQNDFEGIASIQY
jgi:hypothetical protein